MTIASEYAVNGPLTSLPALLDASSETVIFSSASEVCTRAQVPAPPMSMMAPMTAMMIPETLTNPNRCLVSAASGAGREMVVSLMSAPALVVVSGSFRLAQFSYAL
jgi:hypothetical protein